MIITTKIKTDLALSGEAPLAEAVQDDKYSRDLEISLFCGGVPWTVPAGARAVVRYLKPDGTGGSYDTLPDGRAACTISGSVVTVALAPQVCAVSGMARLAVGLLRQDAEIHTFGINLLVHRNPGIEPVSQDYTNMTAYVKAFGWKPGSYLSVNEKGWIVSVDPLSAMDKAMADALSDTVRTTAIHVTRDADSVILTATLASGRTSISEVVLNADGYPVSVVTDGLACAVDWEGF